MRNPFEGSQARLSRSCLTASMGLGGIATSAQVQRRRSPPRSVDTSHLFRMTRIRAERSSAHFGFPATCPANLATQNRSLYQGVPAISVCYQPSPIMTTTDTSVESQPFQAEVSELLHLMVHSVYSETDIFLRELISNASDACDKLRYEAIAHPELIADGEPPKIRIAPNKKGNTLVAADSGIGMDRQELIDNLGTIARSGTRSFLSRLTEAKDGAGLIGQFGVGFYSAFMVAERIVVTSRRAGADQVWTWSSSGGSGFEIAPAGEDDAKRIMRGTEIVLHLKPDAKKYLESYEIERVVGAYSDNIQFPILLKSEDGEPRQINSASALWQRPKSELTPEDYKQAYTSIAGAYDDPAMTLHYRAEGRQSYAVLLFAPSTKPFDLFEPSRKGKVKLYVRRVFIPADADLLPAYLRFIRGVVDSEDLPLNISREMLQNNPQLAQIRKAVTSRVITEFEQLGEKEPENFA